MKIFENCGSKNINFIDKNNVFVGYNFASKCCENFGWIITKSQCEKDFWDYWENGENGNIVCEYGNTPSTFKKLENYIFDINFFKDGSFPDNVMSGDKDMYYAMFKLVDNNNTNALYLIIFNSHNGYYSHGFNLVKDNEIIEEGYL